MLNNQFKNLYEGEYQVYISATVDHINWTCPKCQQDNESGSDLDTCCSNCGYDIENDVFIPSDMDDILTGWYNDEEDEIEEN